MPALGLSLVLIAAGAILAYAVEAEVSGIEIRTVGFILLVVGIVGAMLSALFMTSLIGSKGGDADVHVH